MRLFLPMLILLTIAPLTGYSQSESCYQTVTLPCTTDSVVDYITAREKRNLFKLAIALDEYRCEVAYLIEAGKLDSLHIAELRGTILHMEQVIDGYKEATYNYNAAYTELDKSLKLLKRQLRLTKLKALAGGVVGSVSGVGIGVMVTFAILKF